MPADSSEKTYISLGYLLDYHVKFNQVFKNEPNAPLTRVWLFAPSGVTIKTLGTYEHTFLPLRAAEQDYHHYRHRGHFCGWGFHLHRHDFNPPAGGRGDLSKEFIPVKINSSTVGPGQFASEPEKPASNFAADTNLPSRRPAVGCLPARSHAPLDFDHGARKRAS